MTYAVANFLATKNEYILTCLSALNNKIRRLYPANLRIVIRTVIDQLIPNP